MKKNNALNIRRLVTGSFVQTNQRPSVLNYRLTDFYTIWSALVALVLKTSAVSFTIPSSSIPLEI